MRRKAVRTGPLWISAGLLIWIPVFLIFVLNTKVQHDYAVNSIEDTRSLYLPQTNVNKYEWRHSLNAAVAGGFLPPVRVLGQSPHTECLQVASTGEVLVRQVDYIQILVMDSQANFWFQKTTNHNNKEGIDFVGGYIRPTEDPNPWYAAQRIVQEAFGIPSSVLLMDDHEGALEGTIPPIARDHWKLLGRTPLHPYQYQNHNNNNNNNNSEAMHPLGTLYTYVWNQQQSLEKQSQASSLPNRSGLQQAIRDAKFTGGPWSYTSLSLVLAQPDMDTTTSTA